MHFVADGSSTYQRAYIGLKGSPVFPLPKNVMYGRMMVWLDSIVGDGVHWTMIQGEGPVPGQSFDAFYRYGGMNWDSQGQPRFLANYETSGVKSDCWQGSQSTMPVGSWACVEWRFDGDNDEMSFWLNGTEVTDLAVKGQGQGCIDHDTNDKWLGPSFERLRLGYEKYQDDGKRELYIDDVVISTDRVGCP